MSFTTTVTAASTDTPAGDRNILDDENPVLTAWCWYSRGEDPDRGVVIDKPGGVPASRRWVHCQADRLINWHAVQIVFRLRQRCIPDVRERRRTAASYQSELSL